MTTGRNFDEILRALDSIQLTAKYQVATPANWKQGEDVIITAAVSDEDAEKRFGGFTRVLPYLRTTPQPRLRLRRGARRRAVTPPAAASGAGLARDGRRRRRRGKRALRTRRRRLGRAFRLSGRAGRLQRAGVDLGRQQRLRRVEPGQRQRRRPPPARGR